MDKKIEFLCRKFGIEGEYLRYELVTNGHINTTYKVYFFRDNEEKDYILQRINTYVFKNPVEVMNNISSVTEYIRAKIKQGGISAKRFVLHYYKNVDDGNYYIIGDQGGFWRLCRYIDDSVTFNETDNLTVLEESGKAFGNFQLHLADYPAKSLHIAIPHFHNTVMRYQTFKESIERNDSGRRDNVLPEIEEYLALEEFSTRMYKMQKRNELPLRVTHNDTKCNNVLFDATTFENLAVIDLDTVMPGLVAFDFGDSIRFAGNTCKEDETDLSKVKLDMAKYEAFTRGFVKTVGHTLTQNEKDTLALGAVTMTVECGMRFLTDYLDGDKYFKVEYDNHNLDRARCQLALAKDMIAHFDEMNAIVKKYL
ncbi:MAG: aminoglycoside phosphotransferase family protein [Clostridia bacterium]|nr:aminoglycoside phosphotransferase family protein [Clostridia bacterium]